MPAPAPAPAPAAAAAAAAAPVTAIPWAPPALVGLPDPLPPAPAAAAALRASWPSLTAPAAAADWRTGPQRTTEAAASAAASAATSDSAACPGPAPRAPPSSTRGPLKALRTLSQSDAKVTGFAEPSGFDQRGVTSSRCCPSGSGIGAGNSSLPPAAAAEQMRRDTEWRLNTPAAPCTAAAGDTPSAAKARSTAGGRAVMAGSAAAAAARVTAGATVGPGRSRHGLGGGRSAELCEVAGAPFHSRAATSALAGRATQQDGPLSASASASRSSFA
mmetsp:Transcript_4684/g.19979  ORF Transcript_4684/g.19979 Transcript_4684/m.19979 type:complete len:274 (+) Transcript_4684:1216-2037(+)